MPQRRGGANRTTKKRKSTISTEDGTIVHPSSKPFGRTYTMKPPGHTGGAAFVERKDRKGKTTHINGIKVDT